MRLRRIYNRIRIPVCIVLLVFLVLLLCLPVFFPPDHYSLDVQTQRIRCQRIAKDALELQYQYTSEDMRTQAYSELQNMLAGWQAEQTFLQARRIDAIQQELTRSLGDYTSITNAMKAILAHPEKAADATQAAIILDHERNYTLSLNQVISILEDEINMGLMHLFWIECGDVLLVAALIVSGMFINGKKEVANGSSAYDHKNSGREGSEGDAGSSQPED